MQLALQRRDLLLELPHARRRITAAAGGRVILAAEPDAIRVAIHQVACRLTPGARGPHRRGNLLPIAAAHDRQRNGLSDRHPANHLGRLLRHRRVAAIHLQDHIALTKTGLFGRAALRDPANLNTLSIARDHVHSQLAALATGCCRLAGIRLRLLSSASRVLLSAIRARRLRIWHHSCLRPAAMHLVARAVQLGLRVDVPLLRRTWTRARLQINGTSLSAGRTARIQSGSAGCRSAARSAAARGTAARLLSERCRNKPQAHRAAPSNLRYIPHLVLLWPAGPWVENRLLKRAKRLYADVPERELN